MSEGSFIDRVAVFFRKKETIKQPVKEPQKKVEQTPGTIVGDVMIGKIDPKTLTKEQFDTSNELIFHGANKAFTYSHTGEFDSSQSANNNPNDMGAGFYATDNYEQAVNYSQVRARITHTTPAVYSFLPFEAKMLDARDSTNTDYHGTLPSDFVKEWVNFLEASLTNDKYFSEMSPSGAAMVKEGIKEQFLDRLKSDISQGRPIQIRGDKQNPGIFNEYRNGLIDDKFRDFMLSKGYDGMVYREAGEGEGGKDLTGYVFYNPHAIDTFEGWQKRK